MSNTDLQQERRRLGPVRQIAIEADSLVAAHGQLGSQLGAVIRRMAKRRLKATPAAEFAQQIGATRNCWHRLESRLRSRHTLPNLRLGLNEYRDCLLAWMAGSELESVLGGETVEDQPVTAAELALWLQDDNTGCQTGMVRLPGGNVLFWHTEEDSIGYFDQPRVAALTVGGQTWHAFLYPYLLPGPAFGWQAGQFHAVDSLNMRRSEHGTLSCIAAWLAWRYGPLVYADFRTMTPYIDGCAIGLVQRTRDGVSAAVQELGWLDTNTRTLPRIRHKLLYQANCVERPKSRLAHREGLSAAERELYCARGERTRAAIEELVAADDLTPQRIVELLATRRGGLYAYANEEVKAHCVGVASPERIELYVQSGAALPGDQYQPQFHA